MDRNAREKPAKTQRHFVATQPEYALKYDEAWSFVLKKSIRAGLGLAVSGMPVGSAGMEVPGSTAEPFDIVAIDNAGRKEVFSSYPDKYYPNSLTL